MSTALSLKTDEVLKQIASVAGISRTYSEWDDTTEADVRNAIRNGLRRFFHPTPIEGAAHEWSFLEKRQPEGADAAYSTGTVAISGGTVTGTGTVFPTWAADGVLRVDGRTLFVTARGGDTSLTIENDAFAVDAGETYELYRWRYDLPTDFGEMLDSVVYAAGNKAKALVGATEHELRLRYETVWRTDGETCRYAIVPAEPVTDGTGITTARGHLLFWPPMVAESSLSYRYRAVPQDNLDDDDIRDGPNVVQVDAVHAQTLLEAIMAAVEEQWGIMPAVHEPRFQERLAASIKHDRQIKGRMRLNYRDDDGTQAYLRKWFGNTPTLAEV